MFGSKQVKIFRRHFKTLSVKSVVYLGPSKRATNLMPSIRLGTPEDLKSIDRADHNKLMLSIEAKQKSCCLQIESDLKKSRAAILVYRGRVLGSVYSSKTLQDHLFNQKAFDLAIRDLGARGSKLSMYALTDEVVVAAGALFHGQIVDLKIDGNAASAFSAISEKLISSKKPASVVLSHSSDLSVCMIYFFDGKIVGIHSDKKGRLDPKVNVAKAYIAEHPDIDVSACVLPVAPGEDSFQFAFSLSGLADRTQASWAEHSQHQVPSFFNSYRNRISVWERKQASVPLPLIARRIQNPAAQFDKNISLNHAFHVNP